MWSNTGGSSIGLLPGRTWLGPLVLMIVCPIFGLLMTEVNMMNDDKHNGSLLFVFSEVVRDPVATIARAYHAPSWATIKLLLSFAAFQLGLMRLVPGKAFIGPVSPQGVQPEYKANGFQCFLISIFSFLLFSDLGLGWYKTTVIYDNYAEIMSALTVASLGFCFFLWIKGLYYPSGPDHGTNGNPVIDYYWGMELYPRVLGWDVKQFTNCRWGMVAWAIFPISFAFKNAELNGGVPTPAMLLNLALQLVYVAKFFWWETGYLKTMDIQHDRAGFYICWGCLVWVPSVYVSHSLFLVKHSPSWLTAGWAAAIFAIGWVCVYINYDADRQRELARATNGACGMWGRQQCKVLPVKYTTEKGEVRETILLVDGWWSVSRHFHYVPEIAAAFCWSVAGGFDYIMPYFYVIFLTVLLFDRGELLLDPVSSDCVYA